MRAATRRGILGVAAALVPATAVGAGASPPLAVPGGDVELLALCQTFHRLDHEAHALPESGAGRTCVQALAERWEVTGRLEPMRPATTEGRLAKLGVALALYEHLNEGTALDRYEAFVMATLRHATGHTAAVRENRTPPDTAVIAAAERFVEVEDEYRAALLLVSRAEERGEPIAALEAEAERIHGRQREHLDAILAAPCTTPAGLQAVTRAWAAWDETVLSDAPGDIAACLANKVAEAALTLRGAP